MNSRALGVAIVFAAAAAYGQTAGLSAREVVDRALANSPELRSLRAAVAEEAANALLAHEAFRPSASISTTPGYASGLPIAILGNVPAIGSVSASQLLYDPGARAEEWAARSQVEAAGTRLEARTRDLAESAAGLFAHCVADHALLDAARRRVAAHETILAHAKAMRQEGRVRDLDVDRADLQLSGARRIALQAETALQLHELRLRRLIAWPDGQPLHCEPVPVSPAGVVPSDSVAVIESNDPVLRGLSAQIEQLQRASGLKRRFLQPTIAAQIQYSRLFDRYGRYYLRFKPDDLSIGATFDLPLWVGRRRAAAVARLEAQIQQLLAQVNQRKNELELAAREAEAGLKDAFAEAEFAKRARDLAQESLRVSQTMAREGRGDVNDVPAGEVALAEADEGVANARLHLMTARDRLAALRGELPEKRNLTER